MEKSFITSGPGLRYNPEKNIHLCLLSLKIIFFVKYRKILPVIHESIMCQEC